MASDNDDKGLYGKYIVLKPCRNGDEPDGEIRYYDAKEQNLPETEEFQIKRTSCFVLSPEKRDDYGEASRVAMQDYAMMIRHRNPQLAEDIETWLMKTYANITDDEILKQHGVEIKEGGTLTTDEVEIDPDAPKMKVEMDLSEREKAAKEEEALEKLKERVDALWLAISPDVKGEKPMEIGLIDPATDKMWSSTRKCEYKKLGDAEEADADAAHEAMLESVAEAEDERILKELKEKLADERFARKITQMQYEIALAGRDRLLREELALPGEKQQDAEAMGITSNIDPSKFEQAVSCGCGWTDTVTSPQIGAGVLCIDCPRCGESIRLKNYQEDRGGLHDQETVWATFLQGFGPLEVGGSPPPTDPSKFEQVATCKCGWQDRVTMPKFLSSVEINCPKCGETIRLKDYEETKED